VRESFPAPLQTFSMLNQKFQNTLKLVAQKLNQANINWALIASTNLVLQGMEVKPNDIDILIPISEKKNIKEIFKDSERLPSRKSAIDEVEKLNFLIDSVEVEFCCEKEHGFYRQFLDQQDLIRKQLGSIEIPCFKLENEIKAYEYLGGRKNKVDKIRDFLENGSN